MRINVARAIMPALLLLLVPLVHPVGAQLLPLDPVINGDFELAAHQANEPLCTALGPGSIRVFEPGNPAGLPWLTSVNGCQNSATKAVGWSSGSTVVFGDFDGNGDREAKFLAGPADPDTGNHNMWQAYNQPHQAFVAGFSSLNFRVESGVIPSTATIILSLSDTPIADQSPWFGLWLMCQIRFPNAMLVPDAGGNISLDPTQGVFSSRFVSCDDEAAAWATADAEGRREILDGLRLVQHSYWGWNHGSQDVVIDGVSIVGARTAAEALVS